MSFITLIDSPGIIIDQREVVLGALEKYLKGKVDFGDYIIMTDGEKNGCHHLKTFDQILVQESSCASFP